MFFDCHNPCKWTLKEKKAHAQHADWVQLRHVHCTHIHRLIKTGQVSLNIYNVFFSLSKMFYKQIHFDSDVYDYAVYNNI